MLPGSYGHKAMRHLIGMDASQCITCPSSYGLKAMCHLVAMDASQCVTWLLWTQVDVLSGSYGRKSMCYLLVMAACHASSFSCGRKSMRYPIVMDASKGVTWKLWTRVNALHALVVMGASCYRRKSMCHIVVNEASRCVTC